MAPKAEQHVVGTFLEYVKELGRGDDDVDGCLNDGCLGFIQEPVEDDISDDDSDDVPELEEGGDGAFFFPSLSTTVAHDKR
eukprot:1195013-Prorocentrum_minimum.AAC.13